MAKTRKSNTEFDLNAGANESISRAANEKAPKVAKNVIIGRRGGPSYEVADGVMSNELDSTISFRLPKDLHMKLKYRCALEKVSMNTLILSMLLKKAQDENWEDAPDYLY